MSNKVLLIFRLILLTEGSVERLRSCFLTIYAHELTILAAIRVIFSLSDQLIGILSSIPNVHLVVMSQRSLSLLTKKPWKNLKKFVPKFNNININKIVSQKEIHIKNKLLYRLTLYQNSTIKTTFPKFTQPRNKYSFIN